MPLPDSETLGWAGRENSDNIVRQTAEDDGSAENAAISDDDDGVWNPIFLRESFWLSKDAEHGWFDRGAVYERRDSTRGNSSSKSANPVVNNSSSQRLSVKSKASIIGLPRTQTAAFADSKLRTCKGAAKTRLFPKREKSTFPEAEPSSPKVSCMGRVRSKRCRRRSNSSRTEDKSSIGGEKQKSGFCAKLMSVFRTKGGHGKPHRPGSWKVVETTEENYKHPRRSVIMKAREIPVGGVTAAQPPTLEGMVRFTSGRKSYNFAGES